MVTNLEKKKRDHRWNFQNFENADVHALGHGGLHQLCGRSPMCMLSVTTRATRPRLPTASVGEEAAEESI